MKQFTTLYLSNKSIEITASKMTIQPCKRQTRNVCQKVYLSSFYNINQDSDFAYLFLINHMTSIALKQIAEWSQSYDWKQKNKIISCLTKKHQTVNIYSTTDRFVNNSSQHSKVGFSAIQVITGHMETILFKLRSHGTVFFHNPTMSAK